MAPDKRTFVGVFYIILLMSVHPLNARRAAHSNSLMEKASDFDSVLGDLQQAHEEDLQEEATAAERMQHQHQDQDGANGNEADTFEGDLAGPFREENLCDQTLFLRYKDGKDKLKEATLQLHSWNNVELFKKSDANGCVQTYTAMCARGGMEVKETCAAKGKTDTEFRRFRRSTNYWRKSSIEESETAQLQPRAINGTAVDNMVQLTSGGRLDVWVKDGADTEQRCSAKKMNFEAKMAAVSDKLAISNSSGAKIPFKDAARLVLKARKAVKELKSAQKNGCPWLKDQSVDTGALDDIIARSASQNPCVEKAKGMLMSSQDGTADAQTASLAKAIQMLMSDKCEVQELDGKAESYDMHLDSMEKDMDEKAEDMLEKAETLEDKSGGLASALLQSAMASRAGEPGILASIFLVIFAMIAMLVLLTLMCFIMIALTIIILGITFCLLKGLVVLLITGLSLGVIQPKYNAPKCMAFWLSAISGPNAAFSLASCAVAILTPEPGGRRYRRRRYRR